MTAILCKDLAIIRLYNCCHLLRNATIFKDGVKL